MPTPSTTQTHQTPAEGWNPHILVLAGYAIATGFYDYNNPNRTAHRWWVIRYYNNSDTPMHPVVNKLVQQYRPLDWQQLLLEWPHVSKSDPALLTYTQNDAKGEADIQTKTKIGKYLTRHWPSLPDHVIRDAVAGHSVDKMEIVHTREEIIRGVELGPQSCMKASYGSIPFTMRDNAQLVEWFADKSNDEPNWNKHPYAVYNPCHGWGMALRTVDGVIMGRSLVLDYRGDKVFVRTYARRSSADTQSSDDQVLQQWLEQQGYKKRYGWPNGAKLDKIRHPNGDGYMAPYIDGDTKTVTLIDGYAAIDDSGDHKCDNTNGEIDNTKPEYEHHCDDCGAGIGEDDDRTWVGRSEDTVVCECCQDNYVHVEGAGYRGRGRTTEYYVPDSRAASVGNRMVDTENLPHDVVCLESGDYAELDDCVCINGDYYEVDDSDVVYLENESPDGDSYGLRNDCVEIDGLWYHEDDEEVVCLNNGDHGLKDDCWQCEGTDEWYSNDDEKVELDDGTYHKDYLATLVNAKQMPLPLAEPQAPLSVPAGEQLPEIQGVGASEQVPGVDRAYTVEEAKKFALYLKVIEQVAPVNEEAAKWINDNWMTLRHGECSEHSFTETFAARPRLTMAFAWGDTPQGAGYWADVNRDVNERNSALAPATETI